MVAEGWSYRRPHGVRHLLAAYDLKRDRLYGHIKRRKGRTEIRLAFVMDNFGPYLTTTTDGRVGDWAAANNVDSPTSRSTRVG